MEKAATAVSEKVAKVASKVGMAAAGAGGKTGTMTTLTGCPIAHALHSMTAGQFGPGLQQDRVLLEKIQHFDREKIPARNVHALGTGAYGTFTVTNDITKYSCADLFSRVGKKTELFARMSGIFTEQGDPETMRDPRGFALKFYTKEGNWDLLTINTPVFAVRDMKQGPDQVHAFKRDPRNGMWNPTQTWDYIATHPEGIHQALMMFSDRGGTPMSFRYMHSWGCNTFSFINEKKERFWVKFHLVCPEGAKGFNQVQAKLVAGEDPNFLSRDLWDSIEKGNYPKWKFCCQIMPEAEGYKYPWTFDCTKVWKHKDYPLIEIGTVELNKNPVDYFAEVEQVAFSPGSVVPGISYSPDRLLQGRLMVYDDTQYHRLGPNFKQLYINVPHEAPVRNPSMYGGRGQQLVTDKFPHYYPSTFGGYTPDPKYLEPGWRTDGPGDFYDLPYEGTDKDYYEQPRDFWNVLIDKDKTNLCDNIATSLSKCPENIVNMMLVHLNKIDTRLGSGVDKLLRQRKENKYPKTDGETLIDNLNRSLQIGQA